MRTTSELVAGFLLNAVWQTAAVALLAWACSSLLRNTAARYRHALWVAALVLTLALPLWGLFDLSAGSVRSNTGEVESAPRAQTVMNAAPYSPPAHENAAVDEDGPALGQLIQRRRQSVKTAPILLLSLALGYALFLLYRLGSLFYSWWRTRALRRSAYERIIPGPMDAIAARCRKALGLRNVPLVCTAEARAPVTIGGLKPLVMLPESFFSALPDETLVSVLGHEMAHVRRRDYAFNLAYEFLHLPLSFHPLARYIKRQVDRTRELACDEMVTARLLEPRAYARALVNVADSLVSHAGRAFTLGIFDADILEERIMKLTQKTSGPGRRAGRMLVTTAFTLLCLSTLTISTFSFELRTSAAFPAAVEYRAAVEDVLNEFGDASRGQSGMSAPGRDAFDTPSAQGAAQSPGLDGAQDRAQEACEATKRRAVEAIPALVEMLGDDRPTRLLKCWERNNWSPALETFKQSSPGEQAALALASMGTPAVAALTDALNDSSASVRRNAAWAIGELTNMRETERAGSVPQLVSLLNDPDEWVRMAAARALGEIRDERAVERLIVALSDASWKVRELGAWSLGEMKVEHAVETLGRQLLEDDRAEVRETSAWALGEIRVPAASPYLNRALDDREARVRDKARWALSEIEDSDG